MAGASQEVIWSIGQLGGDADLSNRKEGFKSLMDRKSKSKYSLEILQEVVSKSRSMRDVMRLLGFPTYSGGHANWMRAKIDRLAIDRSHFVGLATNKGKVSKQKLTDEQFFSVVKAREHSVRLRTRMLEAGFEYVCSVCGLGPVWNSSALTLQVDHIDGSPLNNCKSNLRFVCPNCHSQTKTFGIKNRRTV